MTTKRCASQLIAKSATFTEWYRTKYLSQFQNVFLQIANCICPMTRAKGWKLGMQLIGNHPPKVQRQISHTVISHKVGDKTTPLRRRKCHPWQKLFSKVQKSLPILAGRVTRPLSFLALWVFLPLIFCPSSFFSPSECNNRNVFPDSKVVWRPVYQSQNFWPNLTTEVIAQNNRTQSVQVSEGLCNHSVKSRILSNIVKVVNHW